MNEIQISELSVGGDARGLSFAMPPVVLEFVGSAADVHVSSSASGAVRGNRYHERIRRAVLVLPGSAWSLHWDEGEGTVVQRRSFDGAQAVLVLIPPNASHAVCNDGGATLWMVACSSAGTTLVK